MAWAVFVCHGYNCCEYPYTNDAFWGVVPSMETDSMDRDHAMFVIQSLGALWLSLQLVRWKSSISFARQFGIAFVTMAAIQELFIRLPLTAGYTVDQKYLFVWILGYLPELLVTCATTLGVICLHRYLTRRYNLFIIAIVVTFYSVWVHLWLTPFLQEVTGSTCSVCNSLSESGCCLFHILG